MHDRRTLLIVFVSWLIYMEQVSAKEGILDT